MASALLWSAALLSSSMWKVADGLPTSTLVITNDTFFSTSDVAYSSTLNTASDGDLWPTAWADDGNLYGANGDGQGFSSASSDFADIVVNRISGTPSTGITGVRLSGGAQVGPIWASGTYNRKPTGMVAVDGNGDGKDELYLVVQALNNGGNNAAFNDVPAASISMSTDYGVTWTPTSTAMFTNYLFTTVWFLDFGQSNSHSSVLGSANENFVYAYGIDNNWRDSTNGAVPDPQSVYLARAPISSIQEISTWQWFSGTSSAPAWSTTMSDRQPVLTDTTRVYVGGETADGYSVISQGSVVYNAPLNRYIYTSWTDYTFNFYEAPQPWGPFTVFEWKDFGVTPWFGQNTSTPKNGGYATTIPSKFISADGLSMWVQSNWFVGNAADSDVNYNFSLRPLTVTKYVASSPNNTAGTQNLALPATGAVAVYKGCHYGHSQYLNDGGTASEDSWDGSQKNLDRWGYEWPHQYNFNKLVYTTGSSFPDGGWFASGLIVQVRQNFQWVTVTGLSVSPEYPYSNAAVPSQTYTFTFNDIAGDGIHIIGVPGGTSYFTSIEELAVYYS